MRAARVALAVCAAALAFTGVAEAKSYTLPRADSSIVVEPDGSLAIQETITFLYLGPFSGAYRATPTVVSISAKPRAAASAASAARSAGFSLRFVTCAWFAGRRRARSFLRANISSTGSRRDATRASRAGVRPRGISANT